MYLFSGVKLFSYFSSQVFKFLLVFTCSAIKNIMKIVINAYRHSLRHHKNYCILIFTWFLIKKILVKKNIATKNIFWKLWQNILKKLRVLFSNTFWKSKMVKIYFWPISDQSPGWGCRGLIWRFEWYIFSMQFYPNNMWNVWKITFAAENLQIFQTQSKFIVKSLNFLFDLKKKSWKM